MTDAEYELPGKLEKLIATLATHYGRQGNLQLQRLLVNSSYRIDGGIVHENWNGGVDGHAIYFQVPGHLYLEVFEERNAIQKVLAKGLNSINAIQNEFIQHVSLEPQDDPAMENWRERSGVLQRTTPLAVVTSESQIRNLWIPGYLRLFLGHKADRKIEISKFKNEAVFYGLSCFVAHADIEPTREWQNEIEKALFSMDAFVAFLTDDFHDSNWTDQEVGVAIGRGVPIVSIRLGTDPYGFIGKYQGLAGSGKNFRMLVKEVYDLLWTKTELELRLVEGLVTAFENAQEYAHANTLMAHLERIRNPTAAIIERLERAPKENSHVGRAFQVQKALPTILSKMRSEPHS